MFKNIDIMKIINNISEQRWNGSTTNKTIAMYLTSIYKKNMILPKIIVLSKELNISTSAISKFMKLIEVENYSFLRYIYEQHADFSKKQSTHKKSKTNDNSDLITNAKEYIENANRIMLISEGSTWEIQKTLSNHLVKKGYNIIFLDNFETIDFVGQMLKNNDLIIIISCLCSEPTIQKIISNSYAKKIGFTSTQNDKLKFDIKWSSNNQENIGDSFRDFDFDELLEIQKNIYEIIRSLPDKWD